MSSSTLDETTGMAPVLRDAYVWRTGSGASPPAPRPATGEVAVVGRARKKDRSSMPDRPPLIVTAALDEGAFAWFEDLRRTHFPPGRNQVPAHLTLFHALPGEHEAFIAEALKAACRDRGPMRLSVRGPWFIGRGVAYRLASPELEGLRSELANAFGAWLTPQDRAPFRPHITIQNKADPSDARLLLERLQLEFEPFEVVAEGLLVWRYLAGPWEAVARLDFGAR